MMPKGTDDNSLTYFNNLNFLQLGRDFYSLFFYSMTQPRVMNCIWLLSLLNLEYNASIISLHYIGLLDILDQLS